MEFEILNELNYQICIPTGFHFMTRYLDCIHASERTRFLAFYYAERNLQEFDMLSNKPHKFAAAAVYAALKQQSMQFHKLDSPIWTSSIQEESGLLEADVTTIAQVIMKHVSEEPETASRRRLVATKKKYSHEKYLNVSSLVLPSI